MKPVLAVTFVTLLAGVGRGDPADRVILAAMKLSEQPNYTWTSTVSDDARTYEVEGRTDRRGVTWMRLPQVRAIAQRLGREAEPQLEAVFRDPEQFVIRTDKGWQTLRELPKRSWDWHDDIEMWAPPASVRGNLSAAALAGLDPLDEPLFPTPVLVLPPEERRAYSNAQFALSHPHDELAIIVSSHAKLEVAGDVATGTLTDLGAQLLLVRDGQDHLKPLAGAGVFKLQIQGGIVTRYQLRLEGILLVDRKKVHVHQESNTRITAIGSTRVEVPEEARRKLGL